MRKNLTRYPMTEETKRKIESMRKKVCPQGYRPPSQAKFIDKLINGRINGLGKKRKFS